MKNLFASLFNKSKTNKVQVVDPKKILFSVPTLSDDIAPLEPLNEKPSSKDFGFHEDDWCQVEFFSKCQIKTIQQILKEYKQFEQAHRAHQGWNAVYVRKVQRVPVLSSNQPIEKLEKLLGAKAGDAPFLFTYGATSGKVKNGFTIPLGGNITIYGYVEGDHIPVLGASVGKDPRVCFLLIGEHNCLLLEQAAIHKLKSGVHSSAQHSVHPTGGSLRVFWQFVWLEVGSGKTASPRPAHPRVTHPVRRLDS